MINPEQVCDTNSTSEPAFSFDYSFNEREIKILARLLRNNQDKLPQGLEDFARQIELLIYQNMSIDEVEKFYS
ncbi:MAG: hypothetical protein K6B73_05390 [Treponema sp.]|nr:hypothetical protein [Treponema sp.]